MMTFPVVIIGAGPAGLSAAMQLSRQGITHLVLERKQIGGLLLNANWVENYPGFVEGISGPDLADLFRRQAERLGVSISEEDVQSVKYQESIFEIQTNQRKIQAKILVAATGTRAKTLPETVFPESLEGKLYSDVYPLVDVEGKTILIIGAGDAALDYALNLSRKNEVVLLNRSKKIKGLSLLWDRVQEKKLINYYQDMALKQISRTENDKLLVKFNQEGKEKSFVCDYLVTAIGREPDWGFAGKKILDKINQLQDEGVLYIIGDLHNGEYRQTSLAVGDGIRAAMDIGNIIEKG